VIPPPTSAAGLAAKINVAAIRSGKVDPGTLPEVAVIASRSSTASRICRHAEVGPALPAGATGRAENLPKSKKIACKQAPTKSSRHAGTRRGPIFPQALAPGRAGRTGDAILTHDRARVFRGVPLRKLRRALAGATSIRQPLPPSRCSFDSAAEPRSASILGMSGDLRVEAADYAAQKARPSLSSPPAHALVFSDPRMFGRVLFHAGPAVPAWWTKIAPAILSAAFTVEAVAIFLKRPVRAPIKAALLMQERFPGWATGWPMRFSGEPRFIRAGPPARCDRPRWRALWRECRRVCRIALATIADAAIICHPISTRTSPTPGFSGHRWDAGGICPRTKKPLSRAEIGGRTTCWSPARQKLRLSHVRRQAPSR